MSDCREKVSPGGSSSAALPMLEMAERLNPKDTVNVQRALCRAFVHYFMDDQERAEASARRHAPRFSVIRWPAAYRDPAPKFRFSRLPAPGQ
jgi:hypothetical protein